MALPRMVRAWSGVLVRTSRTAIIAGASAWAVLAIVFLAARWLGSPDRLSVSYWTNPEWSGVATEDRTEGAIRTDKAELRRLLGDSSTYSAVFSGVLFAPRSDEYQFTVTSDDGSWVVIDGATVIDNGGRHGAATRRARLRLSRGGHALVVRYFDGGGLGELEFSWRAVGRLWRRLPPGVLYPAAPAGGRAKLDWELAVARTVAGWLLAALGAVALAWSGVRLARTRSVETAAAVLLFAAVLGVFAAKVVHRRSTSVTACDTYAYLQGATAMVAQGPLHSELYDPLVPRIVDAYRVRPSDRDLAFLLSPHGHYVYDFERGVSYNVFPPGLMWLLLPFVASGGSAWALLVMPVLTVAFAAAFFVAGRRHLEVWCAACAALFVVSNPVVVENTVLLMSDVPSMVLTAAAVYILYLNVGKARPVFPALAGACFGAALTVRYSNAAAIVPVFFIFGVEWARRREPKVVLGDAALFGATTTLTGIVPLALYATVHFGTPLHLTYDPYTASHMSPAHFAPNLGFYAHGVVDTFGVPLLAVVAVGCIAALIRKEWRLLAACGLLTVGAFLLPYAFERLREHRYLMPVYPWLGLFYGFGALVIASLLGRVRTLRRLAVPTLVTALLVVAPLYTRSDRFPGGTVGRDRTCVLVAERTGPRAVVFCDLLSGPLRLYAGLTGYRFGWTRAEVLTETCKTLARLGRPVYFLLDSEAAEEDFRFLRDSGALPAASIASAGDVAGLPLWRYVATP
jgi:hypothetical protein